MRVLCNRFQVAAFCLASSLMLMALPLQAQVYKLQEMNTRQIESLDRGKTIVIIPGGILEEHGPYLPTFTDGYVAERISEDIANAVIQRSGWRALLFPTIPLGHAGANTLGFKYSFPGSYTVRASTLRAVYMDLATELGEQGFRWIFVLDAHGGPGHGVMLNQASDYFHDTYGGTMVHLHGLVGVGTAEYAEKSASEKQEDGFAVHGGMDETSEILFLRPDPVKPEYQTAKPYRGEALPNLVQIAQSNDWLGYFGSPRLASAAFGANGWKNYSAAAISMVLRILDGYDYTTVPRRVDSALKDPTLAANDDAASAHDEIVARKQTEWLRMKGLLPR
jgi:creatinine amidohydrolase/Fe(II)-dependent formamide hydrolase-like protein